MPDACLTVVMITYNRRAEAVRAVGEHLRLPERPPVIVLDNASADGTADAVQASYPSVRVARLDENRGAAARNLGVRLAGTAYVAFSDDDSWWEPGSLERACELLDRHPSLGAVTARTLVGEAGTEDPMNEDLAQSPLPGRDSLPGPRVMGFLGCATVVRAAPFLAVGGFNEHVLVGGEEELLACELARAGWDIVYVDELVVHHHPSKARSGDLRRRQGVRNALWFFWLRRPVTRALRRTLHLARTARRDRVSLLGALDAVRGMPWVLRERETLPAAVERDLRLLDAPQMGSGVRSYGS